MPSLYTFEAAELPCSHPTGLDWIRGRLVIRGYHNVSIMSSSGPNQFVITVGEANVSKNQLLTDMWPPSGKLTANQIELNVPPLSTQMVTISGAVGKVVKVRFGGVGFVQEHEFVMPGSGNYEFQFGACPAGQRVVTPQLYDFYAEDGLCSPVGVLVTFR